MSRYSVIPSLFQVNEGDTITTAVTTDLPAGSRIYYKVVGTKVTAGDFSSGGISGSVKMGAGGVASILHKLKADKATEGEESFIIQIFSDKKMKTLVGESDVVRVTDTSTKNNKNDAITGQKIIFDELEVVSDVVYVSGSKIESLFQVQQDPDSSLPYQPLYNQKIEIEIGNPSFIVVTRQFDSINQYDSDKKEWILSSMGQSTSRMVFEGTFTYGNGKIKSAYVKRTVTDSYRFAPNSTEKRYQSGFLSPPLADGLGAMIDKPSSFLALVQTAGSGYGPSYYTYDQYRELEFEDVNGWHITATGDEETIRSYQNGRFFSEGWWNNPFTPNLI